MFWTADGPIQLYTINHVHALGSEGSAGGPYIMHSASDTIGPGGWGQRSGREPA